MSSSAISAPHCDVGKSSVVVFDGAGGKTLAIANEPEARAGLAASLDKACLVVCESTGGYESGLLAAMLAAGVPARRADARKVKAFIRSFGTLGKTDAIDAKAIARYAEERHAQLPRWEARDPERLRLHAMVLTQRDLVRDRLALGQPARRPRRRACRGLPRRPRRRL